MKILPIRVIPLALVFIVLTACGGGGGGGGAPSAPTGNTNTTTILESSGTDWATGTVADLMVSPEELTLNVNATTTYVFTNCAASGRLGPVQGNCDTEYTGTTLANAVTITGSGIQNWTVPTSGLYRFKVSGAGHNADGNFIQGAIVQGTLELAQGSALKLLVGQQGASARGGSGGSFVTLADNTPLLVAGGAAGMRSVDSVDINNRGSTSTAGNSVICGTGASGGVNGGGGQALGGGICSGSGAGLLGNGQDCGGGVAFVNGGLGGNATLYVGGFGGGAGVDGASSPGGGGGYSGGAVFYTGGGGSCAGGGGSFIASTVVASVATSDGYYDGNTVFNGSNLASLSSWRIGHGLVEVERNQYVATGMRTSPVFDISTSDPSLTHIASSVSWDATVPAGTSLLVEVRVSSDGGTTWSAWSAATSGASVPGLSSGMVMNLARLQTRTTFSTSDVNLTPIMRLITIAVTNKAP